LAFHHVKELCFKYRDKILENKKPEHFFNLFGLHL
jgi:hypothetical protein